MAGSGGWHWIGAVFVHGSNEVVREVEHASSTRYKDNAPCVEILSGNELSIHASAAAVSLLSNATHLLVLLSEGDIVQVCAFYTYPLKVKLAPI